MTGQNEPDGEAVRDRPVIEKLVSGVSDVGDCLMSRINKTVEEGNR